MALALAGFLAISLLLFRRRPKLLCCVHKEQVTCQAMNMRKTKILLIYGVWHLGFPQVQGNSFLTWEQKISASLLKNSETTKTNNWLCVFNVIGNSQWCFFHWNNEMSHNNSTHFFSKFVTSWLQSQCWHWFGSNCTTIFFVELPSLSWGWMNSDKHDCRTRALAQNSGVS